MSRQPKMKPLQDDNFDASMFYGRYSGILRLAVGHGRVRSASSMRNSMRLDAICVSLQFAEGATSA